MHLGRRDDVVNGQGVARKFYGKKLLATGNAKRVMNGKEKGRDRGMCTPRDCGERNPLEG